MANNLTPAQLAEMQRALGDRAEAYIPSEQRSYVPIYKGGDGGESGSPSYTIDGWYGYNWQPGMVKDNAELNGTPFDRYDASGNYLGSNEWSGLHQNSIMDDLLPLGMVAAPFALTAAGVAGAGAGAAGAGGAATAAGDAFLPGMLGAGGSEVAMGSLIPGLEAYALPAAAGAAGGAVAGDAFMPGALGAGGSPVASGGLIPGLEGYALPAAASGGGGGFMSALQNAIPSGASSWLGPAATALGGLAGSQGQESSQSSQRRTDPRVDPYLFGSGANPGLLGYTQQQLASQMSPGGMAGYDQMQSVGRGLLGTPVAGAAGADFSGYGGQSNPWMSATANEIGRRTQEGLGQAFNQIRSNAVGVGGLGGSRQGIAESNAIKGAMDSMQGQLAGMYGADWLASQNRGLTQRSQDMGYDISRRGQDLTQIGLGADLYNRGAQGGWLPLQNASNIFNQTAGNNVTSTSGSQQGGGWQGGLGGAMAAGSFARQMGWI
jgi:hypothetical protein